MSSNVAAATDRRSAVAYLGGLGADLLAESMWLVALAWAAVHSGSAAAAAGLLAIGYVPRVAVMLFGGAIADSFGLARTTSVTLFLRLLAMIALGVALSDPTPSWWFLAAASAAFGLVDAVHIPAVRGLPGLLGADAAAVGSIQGLASTVGQVVTIVGAPVAGALIAWRPGSAVAWVCCALLVVAQIMFGRLRRSLPAPAVPDRRQSIQSRVTAGLRTAWGNGRVRVMLIMFLSTNALSVAPIFLGVPLRAHEQGWSATVFGVASLGFAAGSAVGAAVMARLRRRISEPIRSGVILWLLGCLGLLGLSLARDPASVTVCCAYVGLFFAPGSSIMIGEVQSATPKQSMGSMMAVVGVAIYGFIPLGEVIFGIVVGATSLTATSLAFSAALIVVLAVGLVRVGAASAAEAPVP